MILIVDDTRANIIALQKILQLHNLPVDTAASGEEALRKILKTAYSLIIMDVQMPGMDGFEVVETLAGSNRTRDIPVIFLSAVNIHKKFIARGYESGGVDYITKPVDPELLILKVKTFLKISEQKIELKKMRDMLSAEVEIRKKAQEELSNQMEDLQSVLRSLPEAAFIISPDGVIEYVNEHWYHYSNGAESLPEADPNDQLWENWKLHAEKDAEFVQETRIRHIATGEFRHFVMKIVPVRRNDYVAKWLGTFTDIHAQKLANEILEQKVAQRTAELTAKNEELEFRNHELQQFSWVVSHDLKEPIRKIELFSKMLQEKYLVDDEKALHYADRTIVAAQRMSKLIEDLIEYARLSSNAKPDQTDLNEVISEVLLDFDYLIEDRNAEIIVSELPVINAIQSQLRQLFQNLIGNSLKFVHADRPPVIEIRSELVSAKDFDSDVVPDGQFCRISITDNGIGFDQKYVEKVFVIFQSLNDRKTFEGTGIGLAIAKKIIEKHNGIITAYSELGKGSTFVFVLPV